MAMLYFMYMKLEQAMLRFGKNVRKLRLERKLTQEMMRDHSFNYRYFQKIESGKVNPTLDTLLKLAKALDCSLSDLLD